MGVCRCSGPMERRLRAGGVHVARMCRNTLQKGAVLESKHVQTVGGGRNANRPLNDRGVPTVVVQKASESRVGTGA